MVSTLLTRTGGAALSFSVPAICTLAGNPLPESASSSRLDDLDDPAAKWRRDPRERRAIVDDFQQCRLLAVEVLGRAFHDEHLDNRKPPRRCCFGDRGSQPRGLVDEGRLRGDHDRLSIHRSCGDECPFDHCIRVVADDHSVLERARLTLGCVDDDRRAQQRRRERLDRPPLLACRESGPAPDRADPRQRARR